jgi:cytochrome b
LSCDNDIPEELSLTHLGSPHGDQHGCKREPIGFSRRMCSKIQFSNMVAVMDARIVPAAGKSAKLTHWRLKIMFWLDATLLIFVCALQTLHFTGLVLHEWLGLAVVPLILIHLLFAWNWIAAETRRFFTSQSPRARVNYLLNLALFAAVTAAIYSGILISQQAVPAFTRFKPAPYMDWRWDRLHSWFADIVVLLVGLHLAVNWEWALAAGRRIFRRLLGGER